MGSGNLEPEAPELKAATLLCVEQMGTSGVALDPELQNLSYSLFKGNGS